VTLSGQELQPLRGPARSQRRTDCAIPALGTVTSKQKETDNRTTKIALPIRLH
jgi:hypothetical protein